MRFMVMIKADGNTEAGVLPSQELIAAMGKYNEELANAGVLLAGDGLQPTAKGARVMFSGDERRVEQGPFVRTKDLIAGFWVFQTASLEEAIDWVKRAPNPLEGDAEIEIRQIYEVDDFGEVITPELRDEEEHLRQVLR